MEIKLNIPEWLKIPLYILLPSVWLGSGMLLLLPDKWLDILYLLSWRNEKGFSIGLAFIVSSCLLLVYLFFYLRKVVLTVKYNLTVKRKTIRKISNLNDTEKNIIFNLYNSPGYTCELDYNQPLIQGLLARNYIYMGGQQQVTLDVFTNCIPARFTLQPYVYQTLDHYKPKIKEYIRKMEKRVSKAKRTSKKEKLKSELEIIRENYNRMYQR